MAGEILIKGGRVIDPSRNIDDVLDVLISGGKIKAVEKNIPVSAEKVIDAAGKIVMPGLIDMHTHLREPGAEEAETIESGCEAAAAGGLFFAHCPANCPIMATPMPTPVNASKLLAAVTSPTNPDTSTSLFALE